MITVLNHSEEEQASANQLEQYDTFPNMDELHPQDMQKCG